MKTKPISLEDLDPKPAPLKLSTRPGETFTIEPLSLYTHRWLKERFGKGGEIAKVFEDQNMTVIAEICYFQLREKDKIASLDDFLKLVLTRQDQIEVFKAIITMVGVSQPVVEKAFGTEGEQTAPVSQTKPTGAEPTT